MSETREFIVGREVSCRDGVCGDLRRVIVDPITRTLTHLVVEPAHRRATGHLVPIDLVAATAKEIRLRCTTAEFEAFTPAEKTQFLPGASGPWGYGQQQMLSWPYYGLGRGAMGMGAGPAAITDDRVPVGEVQVRRGEHVHATDGAIGRVQGLVIDPGDHHVTHVLLDQGHLGGHQSVAIAISAGAGVDDGVRLTLTKDDVRDLPRSASITSDPILNSSSAFPARTRPADWPRISRTSSAGLALPRVVPAAGRL